MKTFKVYLLILTMTMLFTAISCEDSDNPQERLLWDMGLYGGKFESSDKSEVITISKNKDFIWYEFDYKTNKKKLVVKTKFYIAEPGTEYKSPQLKLAHKKYEKSAFYIFLSGYDGRPYINWCLDDSDSRYRSFYRGNW